MILGAAGAILMDRIERVICRIYIRIQYVEHWGIYHLRSKPPVPGIRCIARDGALVFLITIPTLLALGLAIQTLHFTRSMMVLGGVSCGSVDA